MPSFDTDVPVLLLRLDPNPFHHGTLGAVRSLGRAGIEVHAAVVSARGPVGRSRFLHRSYDIPAGPVADDTLLELLLDISDRIGRPAALIPMDDRGAIAAARLAGRLLGRFLLPAQPAGLPERVADKAELARLCRELDLPHPETAIPGSAEQAAEAAVELGLPAVAKWSRPWLLTPSAGLRSTTLVRTPDDARRLYELTDRAGSALLLQRRLPGGPDTDWFFHGCFTHGGRCLIGGSGRKERAWPLRTGLTAVGRWLPNPEVERAALRLAGHLGYRGILDLDFRRDTEGRYHLLDFNPRPGAQFRLFTDPSGLDVVRALHLDLTGRTVPGPRSSPGRLFRAENYALLSAVAAAFSEWPPAGPLTVRAGRPGVERAWFAADDPLPFLAMTGSWLRSGARKGAHRMRGAAPAVPQPARPAPAHRLGAPQQP
ncbi:ATP-grasp domain-containing protein [Streptomyces sp. NPDC101393]|uniref:carboxylate--amine ligase n=1 Tax=Streptomyces sp. NPDC101393 TaxID=3366141 RepID=UPI00380A68EA